jgi:hypothetical protein
MRGGNVFINAGILTQFEPDNNLDKLLLAGTFRHKKPPQILLNKHCFGAL